MSRKLTPEHLERSAIVYVRMSTPGQVREHTESRRRQYELVERARELGFASVDVIDEDLGRSGSGLQARPGFQKLVAAVCSGSVGAVSCLEASRLARNGRDWHHLLDLCALVGVVLLDPDGIYDPRLMNDRLLLGLKGTMSEYELGLLRQRSLEARNSKAQRGELRFGLPPGYVWSHGGGIEKDPDSRVVEATDLAFTKFFDFGSARQAWLWFCDQGISLPVMQRTAHGVCLGWRIPAYHNVLAVVTSPIYAGAYAFGRTGQKTHVVDGRARRTSGHKKPLYQWSVLIRDHHAGYISWDDFVRNQAALADNAHMKKRATRKAGRGGRALLSGMIRCGRCGYMMRVVYNSRVGASHRYVCRTRNLTEPDHRCIGVGGVRVDEAVARQILQALTPKAIAAATEAAKRLRLKSNEARTAIERELEEARYEARLAARRYEAVDPDKRLVAHELEARWEAALQRVSELERRLGGIDTAPGEDNTTPDLSELCSMFNRLPVLWNAPTANERLKQRITRILIKEVIANVDDERGETVIVIHWTGGCHTELRIHRNRAPVQPTHEIDATDVVRRMAGSWTDLEIALTLNRMRHRKAARDAAWTQQRVRELRERLGLPEPNASASRPKTISRDEAALRLGVSVGSVTRLIKNGILAAEQVAPCAPWQIPAEALQDDRVKQGVREIVLRRPANLKQFRENKTTKLPGLDGGDA